MSEIPTLDGLDAAQLGHIANGCGGTGFDVPDWIFSPACEGHDLAYWIGCTKEDRHQADLAFYTRMKTSAAPLPWYQRWFYCGMAYTYYQSVRLFASKHFYFGPKKRTFDDLAVEMGVSLNSTIPALPETLAKPEMPTAGVAPAPPDS